MIDQWGQLSYDKQEPTENLTHWIFDADSFVPTAKRKDGKTYSIVSDYLGSPHEMYDEAGKKVWEVVLDIYGRVRTLSGDKSSLPFRYQGQYEDVETGLCYNRFRYYDADAGTYLSQDPIKLDGGKAFYAFVKDPNSWVDVFGLNGTHGHHSDPKFMGGDPKQPLTTINSTDHVDLHRDMNAHLETKVDANGNSMRPKRGNPGSDIRINFNRQQRLDALAEFYSKNKKKYPQASADFFAQHPHLQKTGCK